MTRLERLKRLKYGTYAALGEALGVHGNTARRYCQPPSEADWLWIAAGPASQLKQLTEGALHAGNYYELVNADEEATA
jgi:hypothetical protein